MTLEVAGPIVEGGGSVFVVSGAPAGVAVDWILVSGPGALTPITEWTDENGTASARYVAAPATAGQAVHVRARVYA